MTRDVSCLRFRLLGQILENESLVKIESIKKAFTYKKNPITSQVTSLKYL